MPSNVRHTFGNLMHLLNRRPMLTGLYTLTAATEVCARAAGVTPDLIEATSSLIRDRAGGAAAGRAY